MPPNSAPLTVAFGPEQTSFPWLETPSLSGKWTGHYRQYGRRCPLSATIVQEGTQVHGTMRDRRTDFEESLFQATFRAGLAPGADEEIDQLLRKSYPHLGNRPVFGRLRLPPVSLLEGTAEDRSVRFMKVYQGSYFIGFGADDFEVGENYENHSVEYSGKIVEDGMKIEGIWTIPQPKSQGIPPRGSFLLQRVDCGD